jgi:hypothetical protein
VLEVGLPLNARRCGVVWCKSGCNGRYDVFASVPSRIKDDALIEGRVVGGGLRPIDFSVERVSRLSSSAKY